MISTSVLISVWLTGIVLSYIYFSLCNRGIIEPNSFYKIMIRSVNGEEIKYDKKVALFMSGLMDYCIASIYYLQST